MPYTRCNIRRDVDDIGAQFDGPQGIEFRAVTKPLGLEESALTFQRIPPGCRFPFGHAHTRQEETYVVVRGSGRMNLDGEIIEVGEWDAVRVAPAAWRGYEAGPDGLELLVIGAPNLGDDPRGDVDGQRDWWGDR
ncbi:MAG: cupin domain-containing protein [Gaiellales bacterium]